MDAHAWDERYRDAEFVWTTEPNLFLPGLVAGLTPGRAVDLACGEGRNAVWLATEGWSVTGVDISRVGLEKAARLASARSAEVDWVLGDVTTWVADEPVDLVVAFYLQLPAAERSSAVACAARALAPGGTVVVVAHDTDNLADGVGGPQDLAVLYSAEDVLADLERVVDVDLVVERAEQLHRPVAADSGERSAIDCCVVARRRG